MKVDVQSFIVKKVERAKHSSSALTTNKYMQSHQNEQNSFAIRPQGFNNARPQGMNLNESQMQNSMRPSWTKVTGNFPSDNTPDHRPQDRRISNEFQQENQPMRNAILLVYPIRAKGSEQNLPCSSHLNKKLQHTVGGS